MAANGGLSIEQLAANLEKCAALVKQNNKGDPLLRQTIHDLTYFITGKRVSPRPSSKGTVAKSSPAGITATLGKMVGGLAAPVLGNSDPPASSSFISTESNAATSSKNAARAKADLSAAQSSHSTTNHNWCDEHLTRNCSCQQARRPRPEFRRPTNPKSSLIANGWIEQQRRSKMRTVWKQVIMSLVEGKENHGPALWIQREIIPEHVPGTKPKKPELEALHQIPASWILDVTYAKYSTDNKFTLTVKNMAEEFVFRCPGSSEAAQDWVATIRSIMVGKEKANTSLDDWDDVPEDRKPASRPSQEVDTTPPAPQQKKPPPTAQPPAPPQAKAPPQPTAPPQQTSYTAQPQEQPRMSIKELRAIAHGAGITTHGMERGELERIVHQLYTNHHRSVTPEIPSVPTSSSADGSASGRPWDEQGAAVKEQQEQELRASEEKRRLEREEADKRKAVEEKRRREMEEQRKQMEEQRQREEEERRRLEAERLRREEEEHRKRVADLQAAEKRRREEEQRRLQQQQWAQQQQEWQRKQEEEMQRRQAEEHRQAEERRRQEEAFRHQQWQQQQAAQQHAWQQQQTPFGPHFAQPPPQQHHAPPAGASPVNMKYAKMATQVTDGRLQHIKHSVLVEWALQPPTMQILRSIEMLITSIHTVFPPKYGVAPHGHFGKWAIIPMSEVVTGTQPDKEKLKKAVRKLRFFLHPDKLPREFSEEQHFVCKMLWDITSDAYEEFKKREEELGWMRG